MTSYGPEDYTFYEAEDFALDAYFIAWVLDCSPEHQQFWEALMDKYPHKRNDIELAKKIVLSIKVVPGEELSAVEVDEIANHFKKYKNKSFLNRLHFPMIQRKWLNRAAIVLCFLAAGLLATKITSPRRDTDTTSRFQQVWNHTHKPRLVRLADGTSAILKPGASITYPKVFKDNIREVFLVGEAFFEVHKNPRKPFLVHSEQMLVQVLGTSFTVRSYSHNSEFKVIVNTGKVAVYRKNSAIGSGGEKSYKKLALLTPNEQLTYLSANLKAVKEELAEPLILSEEGAVKRFNFNDAPLAEVIAALKEAYGVDIHYNEKVMGGCTLTASLSDQPLYEKLGLICKALNTSFELNNGDIYLQGAGCSVPK